MLNFPPLRSALLDTITSHAFPQLAAMTNHSPNTFEPECEILGALCSAALSLDRRARALQDLTEYFWHSPDHRVIYEALRRSRERDAVALHEYLRAEVTRLGFPDIDWALYLSPRNPSATEIEILVHTLLALTPDGAEWSS